MAWEELDEDLETLFGDAHWEIRWGSGVAIRNIPNYTKCTDEISTAEMATWPGMQKEADRLRRKKHAEKMRQRRLDAGGSTKRGRPRRIFTEEQLAYIGDRALSLGAVSALTGLATSTIRRQRVAGH